MTNPKFFFFSSEIGILGWICSGEALELTKGALETLMPVRGPEFMGRTFSVIFHKVSVCLLYRKNDFFQRNKINQ